MSGIIGVAGTNSGVIPHGVINYEEGTVLSTGLDPKSSCGSGSWTTGSYNMETVSIQMAKYIKIGKVVHCWFECIVRYISYADNGDCGLNNTAYGVDGLYAYDNTIPFAADTLHTQNGPANGFISIAGNTFGTNGPPLFVNASNGGVYTVGNSYPGGHNTQRILAGYFSYIAII